MEDVVTDLSRGIYRRIYGGFITGQRINRLSLSAEAWFWRLVVTVDDFGNGRADPELCRSVTAGNRPVTKIQVARWLEEIKHAGLIRFYAAKGESFLHVIGFEEWQPAGRNGKRIKRFPFPTQFSGNPGESSFVVSSYSDTHTDTEEEKEKGAPPFSSSKFLTALSDFEQHRKEKKVRVTPTARKGLYKKLEGMGEKEATAALIYSTSQGWTGVFPERNSNGNNRETASERNVRNIKDSLDYLNELPSEDREADPEVETRLLTPGSRPRGTRGPG